MNIYLLTMRVFPVTLICPSSRAGPVGISSKQKKRVSGQISCLIKMAKSGQMSQMLDIL